MYVNLSIFSIEMKQQAVTPDFIAKRERIYDKVQRAKN